MKLPSIDYLWNAWSGAIKRFPIAVMIAFLGTGCLIYMITDGKPDEQSMIFRLYLSCLVFFPFFISATIIKEVYHWSMVKVIGLQVILLLLMLAYWHFMAPETGIYRHVHVVQFVIFLVISHLVVTFIPYLKNNNLSQFWDYNRTLFLNFCVGGLYSVVIVLGIFAALGAVSYLFDINIDDKNYGYVAVLVAGVFHTGFFLSSFPKDYAEDERAFINDKIYSNLVKYVLISLVCLYLIILYAFGFKILFAWELPKGFVASLVLGFSIAGILTYLLNFRLPEIEGSGWVKAYRKWFFYVLLPVTSLLFVGIMRRIGEYGVTEERYFVLITGIFLAILCLYFIVSKRDDIRIIPMALVVCCLITGLGGPVGAFGVSRKSQGKRLKQSIELFSNTNKDADDITEAERESMQSLIKFFTDRRYFEEFADVLDISALESISINESFTKVRDALGANYTSGLSNSHISFYRNRNEVIAIEDYTFHTNIEYYERGKINNGIFDVEFYPEESALRILEKGSVVAVLDFSEMIDDLRSASLLESELEHPRLTVVGTGEKYDFKLVFRHISFDNTTLKGLSFESDLYWKER